MERKFECKNCGQLFMADDNSLVVCPKCKNDNVDIVKSRNTLWKYILFGLAIIVLIVVGYFIFNNDNISIETSKESQDYVDSENPELYQNESSESINFYPEIEMGDVKLDSALYLYSFSVKLLNPQEELKYNFAIFSVDGANQIAISDNGKFKKIPPADNQYGEYTIVLIANNKIVWREAKLGFMKLEKVDKLSVAELQKMIDKRDSSLTLISNKYFSPDYVIEYKGLKYPEDYGNKINDVFFSLDNYIWNSVTVTNLKYDKLNRIEKIIVDVDADE